MDFIKDAMSKAQQSGGSSGSQQNPSSGGSEDYGDKALDFIEKKTGHTLGRDTNEKITDGAREMYEKATGNKVPEKYSN